MLSFPLATPDRRPVSIDLGSNTVRLLVARPTPEGPRRIFIRQESTRLGQGLRPGGRLAPEAVARTEAVLYDYAKDVRESGAGPVLLAATMAVRQAADGAEFMARIGERTGFDGVILSGRQEAELTAAGVLTGIHPMPASAVVFDLGGRSTEFALLEGGQVRATTSVALGAVALAEAVAANDPPGPEGAGRLRAAARQALDLGLDPHVWSGLGDGITLVGTAGTTTTLAAMDLGMAVYDPDRINNHCLDASRLTDLFMSLIHKSTVERLSMPGLPPDRADIIPAGAAVVMEILSWFKVHHFIVSDAGLLEGIWLVAAGHRSL